MVPLAMWCLGWSEKVERLSVFDFSGEPKITKQKSPSKDRGWTWKIDVYVGSLVIEMLEILAF